MSTTTRTAIVCDCGHTGFLVCTENDQPYSRMWEDYRLEGFAGGEFTIGSIDEIPKDKIATLNPSCPQCGQTGKVKYDK